MLNGQNCSGHSARATESPPYGDTSVWWTTILLWGLLHQYPYLQSLPNKKVTFLIFHFTSLSLIVDQIFSISCYSVTIFFQCCIHFSPKSCTDDGSVFTCFICLIHGNYVTLPKQVNIFSSTKRCVFWNSYLRNEKLLIAKVGWTTFCRLEDNHRWSNYPIIGLYLFA